MSESSQASEIRGLDSLELADKVVAVRLDLNVPTEVQDDGTVEITDDNRIQAALPTLNALSEAHAKVFVLAHLGRPKGEPSSELSLAPVAKRLAALLGRPVTTVDAVTGPELKIAVEALAPGDVAIA